jgi:general L-amino acid transport system substrate-binding protein
MTSFRILLQATAAALLVAGTAAQATTLDDVKARGVLHCGNGVGVPGFTFPDNQGVFHGFDIDFCHAIAAAVLGDATKITTTPIEPRDVFPRLTTGAVDVLTHRLTWTYNRDNGGGIEFVGTYFYDGQGFMVAKSLGVKSLADLKGANICVSQGTTTELNIADYFKSHQMAYQIVTFNGPDVAREAYNQGRCDAYSNDRSALAANRLILTHPDDHVVLPETISKEPIGPVVRQGDQQWSHIVKWTLFVTFAAEELGITQANVDDMRKSSENPEVKRLLGVGDDLGQKLGLSQDWSYNIIKQVGNYGEIFERNIGEKSPLKLVRGLNAQWKNGGLIYAPPFR